MEGEVFSGLSRGYASSSGSKSSGLLSNSLGSSLGPWSSNATGKRVVSLGLTLVTGIGDEGGVRVSFLDEVVLGEETEELELTAAELELFTFVRTSDGNVLLRLDGVDVV